MTIGGWINLILSVGSVTVLFVWCIRRVLTTHARGTDLAHVEDAFHHLQMLVVDGATLTIGATRRGEIRAVRLNETTAFAPVLAGRVEALACAVVDGRPLASMQYSQY